MVVLPAIDMRGGRVVRLRQGRAEDETVYGDDPAAMARKWAEEGAEWIHLVDLDGAFDGDAGNMGAVRDITASTDVPCEIGGGVRSVADATRLLSLGIARVIFGTVAITDPNVVAAAVGRHGPERVVVGIDARDGRVAVRGWTETSDVSAVELANRMAGVGVERVVYTDISRDGMHTGPNVEATAELASATGLHVIASGGVSCAADVSRVARHEPDGIEGIIVGKALYDGRITLADAIGAARNDQAQGISR